MVLCGFYTFFGSESKEDWLVIFNNLISRGLKRLALVISDDFSGLKEAISALFPRAKHQLCYIHMQRNIRRNMGKNDAKIFNEELSLIRKDKDKKSALKRFENLCNEYRDKYQFYIEKLLAKKELYFNFIDFPEPIRKHIYTTNIVENFNSRIEVKRINSGGHFQSMKIVDIAIYVIGNNLHQNRWKNPIPAFKECEYEINQLFNLTFAKNAQFLDWLRGGLDTILLVVPWHKSKNLIIPKNIEIILLPPYCPELNPVERLWRYIKDNTIKNKVFETLVELVNLVCEFIKNLTDEVVLGICK